MIQNKTTTVAGKLEALLKDFDFELKGKEVWSRSIGGLMSPQFFFRCRDIYDAAERLIALIHDDKYYNRLREITEQAETKSTIATTILEQLGGALAMLGARGIVHGERSVSIGIRGSRKVNRIVIVLDPTDTYTVTFQKLAQLKLNNVAEMSMVYADQLKRVIESVTGLRCSL